MRVWVYVSGIEGQQSRLTNHRIVVADLRIALWQDAVMAVAHSIKALLPAIDAADYTLAELEIVTTQGTPLCSWDPGPNPANPDHTAPSAFNYKTLNYAAHVIAATIQLKVTPNSNAATVTVQVGDSPAQAHDHTTGNPVTVTLGAAETNTLITIEVTSSADEAQTYTLNVYREAGQACATTNAPAVQPSTLTAAPTFWPSTAAPSISTLLPLPECT